MIAYNVFKVNTEKVIALDKDNYNQMSDQEKLWKEQQAHWKQMNDVKPQDANSQVGSEEEKMEQPEQPVEPKPEKNNKQKSNHSIWKNMLQLIAAAIIGSVLTLTAVTQTSFFSQSQGSDASVPISESVKDQADVSQVTKLNSVADIVDASSNAIVGIVNKAEQNNPFFNTTNEVEKGVGSGVVYKVDKDTAYIVTNNHVIEDASDLEVHLEDGDVVKGELVGTDPLTDIAVVKIEGNFDITPIPFGDSDTVRTGDRVIAIGNPLGLDLSRTVTEGIISAKDRSIPVETSVGEWDFDVLQTDAAINPGNSGGALLDSDGKLIGINSLKIKESGVEGLGFSIPSNTVKEIVDQLSEDGQVERPYVGVGMKNLHEIPEYYLPELPKEVTDGIVVLSVDDASPAGKAGVKVEDVITAIDGHAVKSDQEFRSYLYKELKIGDKVSLDVYRNGKKETITLTLTSNIDK